MVCKQNFNWYIKIDYDILIGMKKRYYYEKYRKEINISKLSMKIRGILSFDI